MQKTYVEKLESNFNPKFISMGVNTESKKYHLVSYVKMLEDMCRQRNIVVPVEPYPVTNNFIYAKDQYGVEKRWTIEEETNGIYQVFHYDMLSMIDKNKTYFEDGKLKYLGSLYVSEEVSRDGLTFVQEMFNNQLAEAAMGARVGAS